MLFKMLPECINSLHTMFCFWFLGLPLSTCLLFGARWCCSFVPSLQPEPNGICVLTLRTQLLLNGPYAGEDSMPLTLVSLF